MYVALYVPSVLLAIAVNIIHLLPLVLFGYKSFL